MGLIPNEKSERSSYVHFDFRRTQEKMLRKDLENKLRGAIWGFFAGDALASPTHWFYGGQQQVIQEYGQPINDYTKPNQQLRGSILNKSDPNGGGRIKYNSKNSDISIIGDVINHGKLSYWSPSKSYHYHATLQQGEITLEASLARVLMKSIVETNGEFQPDNFRDAYMRFMQSPNSHNDTYASTCHRMFFANLILQKLSPENCPDNDSHNVDAIDGLVLPTIVALAGLGKEKSKAAKSSAACAAVIRKSDILESCAAKWSRVVLGAFEDEAGFSKCLSGFSKETIKRKPNPNASDASGMSACYLSSSLPGLIDQIARHSPDCSSSGEAVWRALLSNANIGGENVHRGSILGAVLGGRAGFDALPRKLVDGLYGKTELEQEIEAFLNAVLPKLD